MNKNLVMDCIKLCVITLIAGLLLGIVYNVTKAPIAAQEEKTKQEAYKAVFEDAAKFDTVKLDQKDVAAVLKKNDLGQNTISEVVKAVDKNGKELGYVFSVTNPEGYGGDVTLSVGVRDDGTVNGYETLSISETAGLGMKAKEPEFKSNFKNKKADKFEVVKDGSGKIPESANDKVDLTNKHLALQAILAEYGQKLNKSHLYSETVGLSEAHDIRRKCFSALQMNIKSKRYRNKRRSRCCKKPY